MRNILETIRDSIAFSAFIISIIAGWSMYAVITSDYQMPEVEAQLQQQQQQLDDMFKFNY